MELTYRPATRADIEPLYALNKALIDAYENVEDIDYTAVLRWVRQKLEGCIHSYSAIYSGEEKVGYYHFFRNEEGKYELDNLYILPPFQRRGIGTAVVEECCGRVDTPVMLYVFIRNRGAVALYRRLGFRIVKTLGDSRYILEREPRKYYHAYEERYRAAHARGVSWASDVATPIVLETLRKYAIAPHRRLLEIGCGEGRDSVAVLDAGYSLTATDASREAIAFCQAKHPHYGAHFRVLDCLAGDPEAEYDFVFAVAVLHMLVLQEDRDSFFRFIRRSLAGDGIGLICAMGDGEQEFQSDIATAFTLQERRHESGTMPVAATSCRVVSFPHFEEELCRSGLEVLEKGLTQAMPEFDSLMYAVVRRRGA